MSSIFGAPNRNQTRLRLASNPTRNINPEHKLGRLTETRTRINRLKADCSNLLSYESIYLYKNTSDWHHTKLRSTLGCGLQLMCSCRDNSGGRGWIRTNEAIKRRIYSPDPLTTRVTLPKFVAGYSFQRQKVFVLTVYGLFGTFVQ